MFGKLKDCILADWNWREKIAQVRNQIKGFPPGRRNNDWIVVPAC